MTNGASTKWAPTGWQALKSTGGGWLRYFYAWFTTRFPWLTGLCFRGWFLLLVEEVHGGTPHSCHLAVRGGLWLPSQLKKTAIGSSNTWLGFIVTPSQQRFRMAPTKHELVMSVLAKMMANEVFTRTELDSALGRLQWATNCCPLTKPFLQAFWQWKTAARNSGGPDKLLRGFAHLLQNLFHKGLPQSFPLCSSECLVGS